jgi:hypothetical protein
MPSARPSVAEPESVTLRPEQIKAREYFHHKGTLLPAAQIHDRVAAAFAATEAYFQSVTDDEARARALPASGPFTKWWIILLETHRPSLVELVDLLEGRAPAGGPIPAFLQSADPMARPFRALLSDLGTDARGRRPSLLSTAPERMTDARAAIIMVVNVKEPDGGKSRCTGPKSWTGRPTPLPRSASTSWTI